MSVPDHIKYSLPLLRLGRDINRYHQSLCPDPFESKAIKETPAIIRLRINRETLKLRGLIAVSPSMSALRKVFGIEKGHFPDTEILQSLCYIVYFNYCLDQGEQTSDMICYRLGALFGGSGEGKNDTTEGKLLARQYLAAMFEKGIVAIDGQSVHASAQVMAWITGGNTLLARRLNEDMVKAHFAKKAAEAKKKDGTTKTPPTILSPQVLFTQLKQYVVANDSACRLLAVRGSLHLNRRELLRNGVEAGSNECVLLIGQSGTGKTHIAETFGKLCGLPFASLSASNFTATGYVGLDPDDALKTLIRTVGDPRDPQVLEKARYGVLFMDEWDKRRSHSDTGIDVAGSQVQYEYLRLISGTKLTLGARRYERDDHPIEFNSNGTFFVFAGAFVGLEQIIKRMAKTQSSIGFGGFSGTTPLRATPKIYDALQSYGLIPEFLNRVSAVIAMKPLDDADLIQIAISQHGVIPTYNRILAKQGLTIAIDPAGLADMAAFCVQTKLFARGIRLVVSALVEDLVFNEAKGNLGLSVDAVRQAIERVTTMDGMGVNGFNGLDGINGTDKPDESFNAAEPRAPSREVIYGT